MIKRLYENIIDKYRMLTFQASHGPSCDFIFVHINKTAGSSIAKALKINKHIHLTAQEIRDQIGNQKWNAVFKFSIVRNPYDRILSQYLYRLRRNVSQMADHKISFDQWLHFALVDKQVKYYNKPKMFLTQLDWLSLQGAPIELDYVGRFEELTNSFDFICNQIGVKVDLPHLKKSKRKAYQSYYNNSSKIIVQKYFESDLEYFKYSF